MINPINLQEKYNLVLGKLHNEASKAVDDESTTFEICGPHEFCTSNSVSVT